MAADIGALGALQSVEPLDLSNYKDNQPGLELPKKGTYVVRAPESFPASAFGRTKAGALSIQVDPTIVGPTNEGCQIRFTKISAKPFQRKGTTASQVGDYLRACGIQQGRLADERALADAVEGTTNQTYRVETDWRAYSKTTGFVLEGMENFPSDGNGGFLPFCTDPEQKDESGNPVKLRANLVVTRFISASE